MKTKLLIGLLIIGIVLISGCISLTKVKVLEGVEFQIKDAEYEAKKIIITLSTNVSVENVRIDIVDEADQLLCTRYKDLIAGVTQIEMSNCKAKKKITVSVSPPGGGIVTREFTLDIPIPKVKIVSSKYELTKLILKLDANIEINNTRIEVSDEHGTVLCTKYIDLSEGLNEIEPKECGTETEITVSVTPPEGVMTTKSFSLSLPLLEAKSGLNYQYKAQTSSGESVIADIFITTETASEWQGVIGTKIDPDREATIMQFKLKKADLDLLVTHSLAKEKVLSEEVEYMSTKELGEDVMVWPFIISAFKSFGLDMDGFIEEGSFTFTQSAGPKGTLTLEEEKIYLNWLAYHLILTDPPSGKELTIYVSVAKPYMLITFDIPEGVGPGKTFFKLEKVEERDFDLDYYKGYSIKEWEG